ncbi:MAG UNVERIFIED_CONTAM: toll/interleukin-1 receptor domain-containing protein [Microcystis novacekii LVE1205-3]
MACLIPSYALSNFNYRYEMIPQEAFLSHSSKNREFVSHLANELRRHGVPVWYSETNILGAQQWHDEIGKALRRCDWFIIVLSPDAVDSMWVKRELIFTLQISVLKIEFGQFSINLVNIQNFLGSYLASKLLILMIILKKDAEICFVSLA